MHRDRPLKKELEDDAILKPRRDTSTPTGLSLTTHCCKLLLVFSIMACGPSLVNGIKLARESKDKEKNSAERKIK